MGERRAGQGAAPSCQLQGRPHAPAAGSSACSLQLPPPCPLHPPAHPTPHTPPQASFPYIGIGDLRAVPLAVLDRLQPVPATFLKQLATDKDLFWDLPLGVQRQVTSSSLG